MNSVVYEEADYGPLECLLGTWTGKVFHDQVGYWLWEPESGQVIQTLTIPRGVTLLAGGSAIAEKNHITFSVGAEDGDPDWGIVQSPFMQAKARTLAFRHELTVTENRMSYDETTVLDIYGKRRYEHTDRNTLYRN